jgi:hypothetical protein
MARSHSTWFVIATLLASCATASARTAQIDNKLNLRQGPGAEHRVIVVMPAGAQVTVGECRGEANAANVAMPAARSWRAGIAAFATSPPPPQTATKYGANDDVRVLNWHDREWRDRYLARDGADPAPVRLMPCRTPA